jgi:hypothetical protein
VRQAELALSNGHAAGAGHDGNGRGVAVAGSAAANRRHALPF